MARKSNPTLFFRPRDAGAEVSEHEVQEELKAEGLISNRINQLQPYFFYFYFCLDNIPF